jgi:hypothetical protein
MSSPVEFRLYATNFTLDDLKAGRQPIRSANGELHNVAALQFRYKYRLVEAGKSALEWSEWAYIPFVMEGDVPANDGKSDGA